MASEEVGFLQGNVPYLKAGEGPPLVMIQGLTPHHDVPAGFELFFARSAKLARDFLLG